MQSFDTTDACVPFLLSIGQEEISAITSPCFEASSPSPGGSSLFDRLSRGLSPDHRVASPKDAAGRDARLATPSTPNVDCNNGSLSTIEAEDSLIEKAEEDPPRLRWNGEFNQSLAGRSPKSPTPAHQEALIRNEATHANLKTQRVPNSAGSISSDRLRSTPAAGRFSASLNRQLSSSPRFKHNNSHDRSVSWEISPSKGRQLASSQAKELVANTSLGTPKRPDTSVDTSALTTTTKRSGRSTKDGSDVWREVSDPESGRTYYYHRQTRVSRWTLPRGAVLAKKSSRKSDRSRTREESSLSRLQISLSSKDQNQTSEQSPISPARHHNEASDQGQNSNVTPHISFSSAVDQPHTPLQRQALVHKRAQECSFMSREESKSELEDEAFLSRRLSPKQSRRPEMSMSAGESQLSVYLHSSGSHEECKSGSFVEETFGSSPMGNSAVRESYLSSSCPEAAVDQNAAPADALRHIKSPQDCTAACVFCPYCGLRNTSVAQLSSHLSTCPQFKEMQLHGLSTQIELESTLFKAWSTIGSSKEAPPTLANEPKNVSHSLDSLNTTSLATSYDAFSEDYQYHSEVALKTPTPRKVRREAHASAPVIERKNCPFCEEAFVKGNEFSCHLLKCKERRRARKERRAKKDIAPFATEPRRTPGRRMPWE